MHSAVAYIAETAVIFAILVNFYKYACYRQSYYKWDRFFLIACIAVCYVLPFCKVSQYSQPLETPKSVIIKSIGIGEKSHSLTLQREVTFSDRVKKVVNHPMFYTILNIIILIYVIGAIVKAISVIAALIKIALMKRGKPETTPDGYKIYTANSRTPAFSFFNNIFVGKEFHNLDAHSQEIILNHERQHIRGHHSLDVIIFSLLSIAQWFNPAVKKAADLSRQICENIADSHVTADAKAEYAMLLLKLGKHNSAPSPVSGNDTCNLKERVLSIYSYDRAINRKLRFACSLPILLLLIGAYIIIGGKLKTMPKSACTFPIADGYIVAAEYFDSQVCTGTNSKRYQVAHLETMFKAAHNAKIIAPISGPISSNGTEIAITTGDTTVTIKNISLLKTGVTVCQGEPIGVAMSEPLAIKVEINNRAVNPSILFNY
ncbi:MAG: hypothetical protein IKQ70_02630 [Bacteroidales bacterium]|nr:hypothetical protein [Bacteroidales bacterium]